MTFIEEKEDLDLWKLCHLPSSEELAGSREQGPAESDCDSS